MKRPWVVNLLAIGFLLFSGAGFLRLGGLLAAADWLPEVGMRPHPAYLGLTGAVYGLSGLAVALGLWFGWRKAARLGRGLVVFATGWYWIDKLFISQNPAAKINAPFMAIITVLLAGLALGGLWLSPVRKYLGENH